MNEFLEVSKFTVTAFEENAETIAFQAWFTNVFKMEYPSLANSFVFERREEGQNFPALLEIVSFDPMFTVESIISMYIEAKGSIYSFNS